IVTCHCHCLGDVGGHVTGTVFDGTGNLNKSPRGAWPPPVSSSVWPRHSRVAWNDPLEYLEISLNRRQARRSASTRKPCSSRSVTSEHARHSRQRQTEMSSLSESHVRCPTTAGTNC